MKNAIRFRVCLSVLLATLCAFADPVGNLAVAAPPPQPRWKLVWKDEFSGTKLDAAKWTLCERGKSDWNDTMSGDPRLLKVRSGVLLLLGIVNDDTKKASARCPAGLAVDWVRVYRAK